MREIKFRAWKKSIGMVHSDKHGDGELGSFFDHVIYPVKEWILMQYTGLKDKNKVLIYEGDIIRFHPKLYNSTHVIDSGLRIQARLLEKSKAHWPPQYLDRMGSRYIEVIGNIHQHPELLKGDK